MEKKTEVKPVNIRLICDICKKEMLEVKGSVLLSSPPLRTYCCENNHIVTSMLVYPRIDFEEITLSEMISRMF